MLLTHVLNDLKMAVSESPDTAMFTRFKKHFDKVPHGSYKILSPFDNTSYSTNALKYLITEWQMTAIAVANDHMLHLYED